MELPIFDSSIYQTLSNLATSLEGVLNADVFLYYGDINPINKQFFRDEIENLSAFKKYDRLAFNLTTRGGDIEFVEVMVEIMRYHYSEVYFIVNNYAYSAGTILCMSGDKIFMNYSSSLGPIDPQVFSNGRFIPAQGYLDQFNKLIEKSLKNEISPLEIQMIRDLNLGDLNFYDEARNLTTTLLQQYLVDYKFKDWINHRNGSIVTKEEKKSRAKEIAELLGDNSYWHSHGRHIGINTLKNTLKLKIEDYSSNKMLYEIINRYNSLGEQFASKQNWLTFIHSRVLV